MYITVVKYVFFLLALVFTQYIRLVNKPDLIILPPPKFVVLVDFTATTTDQANKQLIRTGIYSGVIISKQITPFWRLC